ncbi:hypothetical protein P152DRAFT_460086 [Eremomyces bilateralis CBS 781.70]|uniref:Nab2-like CCCH zinc finger domain-containing protein n=1 Tax=Eremomyces bilateralis CBS 781.70 TaxID=1392243 RepID=A0A6G1FYP6_9PEZI|nr:uncharacterized protein P152DRAFT_460086 [Eremomyces bilateralis CBS 781.70]KAF1810796.1 hypothetical protein P152DRAFT_460086 [Eremomyces bilateralis CBS 781.70]
MSIEVAVGSPLADALQNAVQPKLVEVGWTTDGLDDSALSEYIILMLANGKSQDQIASELSNDLLGLGPEDQGAIDFSRWLFEQVHQLSLQLSQPNAPEAQVPPTADVQQSEDQQPAGESSADAMMMDEGSSMPNIPTGPKAMREGNQKSRDKRMLGHLNKAMDRTSDAALHRVRGNGSGSRVNSHSREPPKGPRNSNIRNPLNANPRMGQSGVQLPMAGGTNFAEQLNTGMGMSPHQQMELYSMFEQQARMMQQLAQQVGNPPGGNQFSGRGRGRGKNLFDRVDPKQRHANGRPQHRASQDVSMGGDAQADGTTPMDSALPQTSPRDPSQVICKFNLTCTKADCIFAHQSPAAPPGTTIDLGDECPHGAACTNHKCVGRHPSPARRSTYQSDQECIFWPHCTKPNCPFKHPDMPLCRNGADCTTPNCKFTHKSVMCRFNPCLNPQCVYKHVDGQKKATFGEHVWKAGDAKKEHVSDRKFVADEGEEELIIPAETQQTPDTVTEDTMT